MTLSDLQNRHSVRSFSTEELDDNIISELKAEITMINTIEAGMHFQLCVNDSAPFSGFTKSYGFFRNPRNYIACVIDKSYPNSLQRAGYYAQQIVMKAVMLGLGTCYVGGTYDPKSVSARVRVGEELPFIILIGYPDKNKPRLMSKIGKMLISRQKFTALDFLDTNLPTDVVCSKFPLINDALEAVACAPSSLNKRPAIIEISSNNQFVETKDARHIYRSSGSDNKAVQKMHQALYTDNNISEQEADTITIKALVDASKNRKNLIDLGIAMFNFQAVYPGTWEWGNPAIFTPDEV